MKINDFYCQGYFGRRYDLYDAEIIDESNYSITARTTKGEIVTATFITPEDKKELLELIIKVIDI